MAQLKNMPGGCCCGISGPFTHYAFNTADTTLLFSFNVEEGAVERGAYKHFVPNLFLDSMFFLPGFCPGPGCISDSVSIDPISFPIDPAIPAADPGEVVGAFAPLGGNSAIPGEISVYVRTGNPDHPNASPEPDGTEPADAEMLSATADLGNESFWTRGIIFAQELFDNFGFGPGFPVVYDGEENTFPYVKAWPKELAAPLADDFFPELGRELPTENAFIEQQTDDPLPIGASYVISIKAAATTRVSKLYVEETLENGPTSYFVLDLKAKSASGGGPERQHEVIETDEDLETDEPGFFVFNPTKTYLKKWLQYTGTRDLSDVYEGQPIPISLGKVTLKIYLSSYGTKTVFVGDPGGILLLEGEPDNHFGVYIDTVSLKASFSLATTTVDLCRLDMKPVPEDSSVSIVYPNSQTLYNTGFEYFFSYENTELDDATVFTLASLGNKTPPDIVAESILKGRITPRTEFFTGHPYKSTDAQFQDQRGASPWYVGDDIGNILVWSQAGNGVSQNGVVYSMGVTGDGNDTGMVFGYGSGLGGFKTAGAGIIQKYKNGVLQPMPLVGLAGGLRDVNYPINSEGANFNEQVVAFISTTSPVVVRSGTVAGGWAGWYSYWDGFSNTNQGIPIMGFLGHDGSRGWGITTPKKEYYRPTTPPWNPVTLPGSPHLGKENFDNEQRWFESITEEVKIHVGTPGVNNFNIKEYYGNWGLLGAQGNSLVVHNVPIISLGNPATPGFTKFSATYTQKRIRVINWVRHHFSVDPNGTIGQSTGRFQGVAEPYQINHCYGQMLCGDGDDTSEILIATYTRIEYETYGYDGGQNRGIWSGGDVEFHEKVPRPSGEPGVVFAPYHEYSYDPAWDGDIFDTANLPSNGKPQEEATAADHYAVVIDGGGIASVNNVNGISGDGYAARKKIYLPHHAKQVYQGARVVSNSATVWFETLYDEVNGLFAFDWNLQNLTAGGDAISFVQDMPIGFRMHIWEGGVRRTLDSATFAPVVQELFLDDEFGTGSPGPASRLLPPVLALPKVLGSSDGFFYVENFPLADQLTEGLLPTGWNFANDLSFQVPWHQPRTPPVDSGLDNPSNWPIRKAYNPILYNNPNPLGTPKFDEDGNPTGDRDFTVCYDPIFSTGKFDFAVLREDFGLMGEPPSGSKYPSRVP